MEQAGALYRRLMDDIRREIDAGTYRRGDRIPSEQALMQKYGVSRVTVRRAADALCEQGYLVRRQGRGTFVARAKVSRKIVDVLSFEAACRQCGMEPSHTLLRRRITRAYGEEAAFLGLEAGSGVIRLRRVMAADGEPIMLEESVFPCSWFSFLMEERLDGSLYALLERHGLRPTDTRRCTLEMVWAGDENARLLGVREGEPLFYMVSYLTRSGDMPLAITRNYIVASRYAFDIP